MWPRNMRALKIAMAVIMLGILVLAFAQFQVTHGDTVSLDNRALEFVKIVLPFNMSHYAITVANTYSLPPGPNDTTVTQAVEINLKSNDSAIHVVCVYVNGSLHQCAATPTDIPVSDKSYTGMKDMAIRILQAYQEQTGLDSTILLKALSLINDTQSANIGEVSHATVGDVSLSVSHFPDIVGAQTVDGMPVPIPSNSSYSTTFKWSIAGVIVLLTFDKGTFSNLQDERAINAVALDLSEMAMEQENTQSPSGNSWVEMAAMPTPRFSFGAVELGGKIFCIGGAVNSSSPLLAVNEEYDPILNKWTERAPMPSPRYGFAIAAYQDKIYVFGGGIDNNSTMTNQTLVYDPATNSWSTKTPMPLARMLLQANVVNGKIYLIGGYPYSNATLNEIYDPASDTWTTATPIPTPTIAYESAVANGRIYIISGAIFPNATGAAEELNLTQIYDPAKDSWSFGAAIPKSVNSAGVGLITDTQGNTAIYAVGGETDIFSPKATVQIYYPENNSWSTGPSLPNPTSRLCVAVANNSLYAIGGTRIIGHQGLSYNEKYDPFGTVELSSSPMPSVPESPTWPIVLFLALTLLLLVFTKRRHTKAFSRG
jgi:hypothetical protein